MLPVDMLKSSPSQRMRPRYRSCSSLSERPVSRCNSHRPSPGASDGPRQLPATFERGEVRDPRPRVPFGPLSSERPRGQRPLHRRGGGGPAGPDPVRERAVVRGGIDDNVARTRWIIVDPPIMRSPVELVSRRPGESAPRTRPMRAVTRVPIRERRRSAPWPEWVIRRRPPAPAGARDPPQHAPDVRIWLEQRRRSGRRCTVE